jgi:DNA-binding NarL/FixJ family response regulator
MINVMIVEDQTMLLDSLAKAIDTQENMRVVSRQVDAAVAVKEAASGIADIVLMDVCTENDSSGIVASAKIKKLNPAVKIVIMTGMPDITFVQQAKDAGVDSFVYKNIGTEDLFNVIQSTMDGYSTYPHAPIQTDIDLSDFTEDEIAILKLVCETKSRREIAQILYLSEGTVKRRISEILARTGYESILKLAVHAVSCGLIVPNMKDE